MFKTFIPVILSAAKNLTRHERFFAALRMTVEVPIICEMAVTVHK